MTEPVGTSRILTLVFTDLADSTALKARRGDAAAAELIVRHRTHVRRLAFELHGRVVDWAGDGCFLTFETASSAVRFALRLQALHANEMDLPGVRAGIHVGEVTEASAGDGDTAHPRVEGLVVDLAARIAALARPGQILVSAAVADSVRQRLETDDFRQPVRWRSHGTYAMKGFDEPLAIREVGLEGVASFAAPGASDKARPLESSSTSYTRLAVLAALALAVVVAWWYRAPTSATHSVASMAAPLPASAVDRKSVAVLPFVNMSSDSENEYFSDGISEDLITALSKVSGLRVAARTSSFAFKGKNEDIGKIGEQLHVGAVLEGSVSKAGNRVRITAQLVNVADGYHLWSDSYDRDLQDIFAVRSQVAQTVAAALQVTLAAGERQKLDAKPTDDVEAYQLYMKGRHAAATFADWKNAMRYLQQAIARDPSYALPYVGLAYYYEYISDYPMPGNEALPRAREAAEKALRLDPSLAEPHANLAVAHWWYDRDHAAVRRELQTALTMQPDLATAYEVKGWYLTGIGEAEEGVASARRAVELDPLSSETNAFLGLALYLAHRYDEAIRQLHTTIEMDPDYWYAHLWLGRAYAHTGRWDEAISELHEAERLEASGDPQIQGALGRAYADAGKAAEATTILDRLRQRSREEFISASAFTTLHVGLGRRDEAFADLEKEEKEHSYYVGFWKVDPDLDVLRSDPRFAALLKTVGLEK